MNRFWQGFWGVPNFGRLSLFQWLRLIVVTTVCSVKVLKVCPWSMMANGCGPWTYIFHMISIFKTSSRNIYSIYYIILYISTQQKTKEQWQSPRVGNMLIMPKGRLFVFQGSRFADRRTSICEYIETLIKKQQICLDFAPFLNSLRAQGQGVFFSKCYISHHQTQSRWPGDQVLSRHTLSTFWGHHGEARPSSSQDLLELVQHVYFLEG